MRLYLNTSPVIYLVERVLDFSALVQKHTASPEGDLVVSELTRMECRVKPISENNEALLQDYDTFFEEAILEIVSLSKSVIDRATHLRARYRVKTPDAIHLAAACISKCDVFLTNDHRLPEIENMRILMLS